MNRSGDKTIALLDQVVSSLLMRVGCRSVPVDLVALGQELGVTTVKQISMQPEGYVEPDNQGGFRIVLREGQPVNRTRFSWAHELGHLILDGLSNGEADATSRRYREFASVSADLDEEAKADFVAGMILLPQPYILPILAREFSLESIIRIAKEARVSLAATMIRSVSLATQPCAAFMIRSYIDDRKRLATKWIRTSRSLQAVQKEEFLDRSRFKSVVEQFCASDDSSLSFCVDDGFASIEGKLDLFKTEFQDLVSIFGLYQPHAR